MVLPSLLDFIWTGMGRENEQRQALVVKKEFMRKRECRLEPIILYPTKPSEFDIQADLYSSLKELGYNCHNQVSSYCHGKKSRFDIVVFDLDNQPRIIIEVKDSENKTLVYGEKTNQIEKYLQYGIPVLIFTTYIPKDIIIDKVRFIMNKPLGQRLTREERKYKNMKIVHEP